MKAAHVNSRVVKTLTQFCACALLLLIGACATQWHSVYSTAAPGIDLGDEINLLDTATEKVVAHMARDGRVHLIAITTGGDALHIVVSAQGIEQKKKIDTNRHGYYENLAIADDALGRLHLAIKDKYWVLENDAWRLVGANRCALLACARDWAACATEVSGKELGTEAQWGIQGFGGFGVGIIIPYRIRPAKVMLGHAGKDGWSYRKVLDYHLPYFVNLDNAGTAVLSSDASGRLHLFFEAHEGSSFYYRYARLTLAEDAQPDIAWRQSDGQTIKLINSGSEAVSPGGKWFIPAGPPLPFAVDPQTGRALFFARMSSGFARRVDAGVEIQGKVLGQPAPFPIPGSRPMRLAPAGDDRFHALLAVDHNLIYSIYRAGKWSAVTKVGEFGTTGLFLIGNASIQLASDGRRQALAIWPKRGGILAGRWIRLSKEEQEFRE
ncbi:MAG: hypothetical protein K4571_17920 [Deltaproteobacteria bacterium]